MTDIDKTIEQARAEMLPFKSWEQLTGETPAAFSAFCEYRDFEDERSIRKIVDSTEKNETVRNKKYKTWLNWSTKFRWRERVVDYDKYIEKMKQTEVRKTIEAQGEMHRKVTGKMLDVIYKKLDTMNPEDLTQGTITDWVQVAVKTEREMAGLISPNGKAETKQGEFNFVSDFQGL